MADPSRILSTAVDKQKQELPDELLKRVSRSFHLSLRYLPSPVRGPISLAYLLARTSDSIADTNRLPLRDRLDALQQFGRRLAGLDSERLSLFALAEHQSDPAERLLLEHAEGSLARLDAESKSNRTLIRQVLATILSGQKMDLQRFGDPTSGAIVALETPDDLDDYTYRVAGCVGEFWTRICFGNLSPNCRLNETEMVELGVRYGKGLQLVNILRDLPRDLHEGRCYLPAVQLATVHLKPADLMRPENDATLRPVYTAWLERAQAGLLDGWIYTNAFPRSLARVRISCALPLLIGWRTLQRLRQGRVLDAGTRIKVPRHEVRRLVLRAILCHPLAPLWNRLGPHLNS